MTPRASEPNGRLALVVDFDGTASDRDVGSTFLERFARDDSWKVIDNDVETGRVGSRQSYRIASRLLEGTLDEWTAFALDAAVLDPGLGALAELSAERGWPLEILSDGLGFYIRALLERGGIDLPFRAGEVVASAAEGGWFRIFTPHMSPLCGRCGTCKSERVDALRASGHRVVYVGDGFSDLCAGPRADRLFAKGTLAQHCRARQIPFETFENLADVAVALAPD